MSKPGFPHVVNFNFFFLLITWDQLHTSYFFFSCQACNGSFPGDVHIGFPTCTNGSGLSQAWRTPWSGICLPREVKHGVKLIIELKICMSLRNAGDRIIKTLFVINKTVGQFARLLPWCIELISYLNQSLVKTSSLECFLFIYIYAYIPKVLSWIQIQWVEKPLKNIKFIVMFMKRVYPPFAWWHGAESCQQ